MSPPAMFVIGVLVTLIVGGATALLVYAAILDGRDEAAREAAELDYSASPRAISIRQTARAAGTLDTLITAIDRAGLSGLLEYEGPYTVFAPSDEAFSKLPDGGRRRRPRVRRDGPGRGPRHLQQRRGPHRRSPPRHGRHRSIERSHPCHRSRAATCTHLKGVPK